VPQPCRASGFSCDVVVVGGCGRAGLPLAIALADRGAHVAIYDVSEPGVAAVSTARMPWAEPDGAPMLQRAVVTGRLVASADPRIVRTAEHVILTMPESYPRPGPPPPPQAPLVPPGRGRHAAPTALAPGRLAGSWAPGAPRLPGPLHRAVGGCAGHFRNGQAIILRTVTGPGDTAQLERIVTDLGLDVDVALCPEHIGEGQAVTDLFTIPQIVASRTEQGLQRARRLFAMLTAVQVPMQPDEAELATLFAGAWHYPDRPGRRRCAPRSAGQHRARAAAPR
jgi:UDP-N-acetyl-D-mannosaminuronic acid dehydrogenase